MSTRAAIDILQKALGASTPAPTPHKPRFPKLDHNMPLAERRKLYPPLSAEDKQRAKDAAQLTLGRAKMQATGVGKAPQIPDRYKDTSKPLSPPPPRVQRPTMATSGQRLPMRKGLIGLADLLR